MCSQCKTLGTLLVQFVFGWGDEKSQAWRDFRVWLDSRCAGSLPPWIPYLEPTPESRRLWTQFRPQDDPEENYSKEDYRETLRDIFQNLIERAADPNQAFFWAFEQRGGNPMPFLEQFRKRTCLPAWEDVIVVLGRIYSATGSDPDRKYIRSEMGGLEAPFWRSVRRHGLGPELIEALRRSPIGGLGGWRLTFYLMRSCATLTERNVSFKELIGAEGLSDKLIRAEASQISSESHADWRELWSGKGAEAWEPPLRVGGPEMPLG